MCWRRCCMGLNLKKRGSITDLPFIIAGIFSFAIIVIMISLLLYHLDDKIQNNAVFGTEAKSASTTMSDGFPKVVNNGIIFLFFAMCIVSMILASLISVHPAFIIMYALEWILLIYIGGGIANAYQAIIESSALTVISNYFTLSTFFFRYFPFIIGIMGALLAIIMYKVRSPWVGGSGT